MDNKIKAAIEAVIIILILLQPLFDIYMAVIGERLDIFGISIVTLVRTITIVSMVITIGIVQIKNKYRLKCLIVLLAYLSVVVLYIIAHHFNIHLSDGYFMSHGLYNSITELMYVLRLVIPVLLIYAIIIIKPDRCKIEKTIILVVFIISLIIIITNIFKISYASYSPDNEYIKYNIFDWFTSNDLSYKESLSKGLFVSANQIGALLAILMPVVILGAIKYNKVYNYVVLLLLALSMVIVGTRAANYGFMIAIGTMILGAIIINILKKRSIEYVKITAIFCVFVLGLTIYGYSPARNREIIDNEMYATNEENSNVESRISLKEFKEILKNEDLIKQYVNYNNDNNANEDIKYLAMCQYIEDNYIYHSITSKYIINIYPYTEDPEFWLELFDKPVSVKGNNRSRQSVIIKRIKELNNNQLADTLFGMGATPMNQREYMIENDLISHYYNIGIIGIILFVAPYSVIVIFASLVALKDIKEGITLRIVTYVISIIMTYCVGFFAGHVIDEYIITVFVAVISGIAINRIFEVGGKINERSNA